MTHYKPYSDEWHRKRYLKEALDKYLDEYVDNKTIISDILDILSQRSIEAYKEFEYLNDLEYQINKMT